MATAILSYIYVWSVACRNILVVFDAFNVLFKVVLRLFQVIEEGTATRTLLPPDIL